MDTPYEFSWWELNGNEQLHDDNFIQLGCHNTSSEPERSTEPSFSDEIEDIFDKILPLASTNFSNKRKIPNHDNFLLLPTTELHLLLPIFDSNYVSETPAKSPKLDICKESSFNEDNAKLITIAQYLQMGVTGDEFDSYEIEDLPSIVQQSITDTSMIADRKKEMRLETKPAANFRGRTSSDFKSKKPRKRNGKPSTARPPRYFNDGNTRQYLNLLIPKTYLSSNLLQECLEICIVTPENNGCTYIHPYFKLQVHPTDLQSPNLNPIYNFIDSTTELKPFSDEAFRQLKLKLVVVMHTNNELMQNQQCLKKFNSNEPPITVAYDKHKAFKSAYRLHEIRFAITLWQKKPGEKVFYRQLDKQYISHISIQDKNTKVRTKKSSVNC